MEEEPGSNELKSILIERFPDCKEVDLVVEQLRSYGWRFSHQKKMRPKNDEIKADCKKLDEIYNKAEELLSLIDSVKSVHLLEAIEEGLQGYDYIFNEKELIKSAATGNAELHKILQNTIPDTGDKEVNNYIRDLFEKTNPKDSLNWMDDIIANIFPDDPHLQEFAKKAHQQSRPDHPRFETFAVQLHGFRNSLCSTDKLMGMLEDTEKPKKNKMGQPLKDENGAPKIERAGKPLNYEAHFFVNEIGSLLKKICGRNPGLTDIQKIVSALLEPNKKNSIILRKSIQEWTENNK